MSTSCCRRWQNRADAVPPCIAIVTLFRKFRHSILLGALVCACLPVSARADAVEDFFKAAEMDNAGDVRDFLRKGGNPNIGEKYRGDTGLMVALLEGSMRVFDVLVNAPNIDLEARSRNDNTALMIAAYKKNRTAIDVLLRKGAAINRAGWTPLHYAAAAGSNDIVQVLLDKGAYIDARSPNRTTPLMIAAYEGHYSAVKLLLDRGADVLLKNDLGLNATDLTKRLGRDDIKELLSEYMAREEKQRITSLDW